MSNISNEANWSAERLGAMNRMMDVDGLSAAEVAERLGLSRSAVLGKRYRLRHGNTWRPGRPRNYHACPNPHRHVIGAEYINGGGSLRSIARKYGVSHEAVRQFAALAKAGGQ